MKTVQKIFFAALFLLAHGLHAQMTEGGVRFGLKLGVNGANLYDDANADDKKARIGLTGGAFAKIPLGKGGKLSLRPELLFTTKGATFDYQNGTRPKLNLNYVELPVSLEFNIAIFNLHAGMHAGLLATAEGTFEDSQGNPITVDFDKDDLESLDYGWHLGGGIDLGNIGLHLRVSRGLQGISKDDTVASAIGKLKNSAWALTASYGF
jgi:hypothetical protein